MRTLLNERFAPITTSPGFLRLNFDSAIAILSSVNRREFGTVDVEELDVGFPEALRSLEPLIGGARPRELLVEVAGGWTAYFDCLLRGTDAVSTIGWITRAAKCEGLAIRSSPHTGGLKDVPIVNGRKAERAGTVQFEMFTDHETDWLNYLRTVSATYTDGRWDFEVTGELQPFEETEAYKAKRIRDRFTSEMLERYCQALGLDVFNPAVYGPRAVLIRSPEAAPPGGYVLTLAEVQEWLGIIPGQADELPG